MIALKHDGLGQTTLQLAKRAASIAVRRWRPLLDNLADEVESEAYVAATMAVFRYPALCGDGKWNAVVLQYAYGYLVSGLRSQRMLPRISGVPFHRAITNADGMESRSVGHRGFELIDALDEVNSRPGAFSADTRRIIKRMVELEKDETGDETL